MARQVFWKVSTGLIPMALAVAAMAMIVTACTTRSPASHASVSPPTTEPTDTPHLTPTRSPTPTATPTVAATTFPKARNFQVGTRVTFKVAKPQIDFINGHYDYVMTPLLSQEVRERIQGPQLILYRSIQGTWTDFDQFDWDHIDAHENMFCHHQGERILTIWNSWLMHPNDMVAPDDPEAMNHWINYYAVTASTQVYHYDYDGLFIDSASHRLSPRAVNGKMPDDYDPDRWRQGRVAALAYIKSLLPDKSVVFNGLHSDAGAEESLRNTDGGMWEVFAFEPTTGTYYGAKKWQEVIELVARNSEEKTIVLVTKEQPGLNDDIQKRLFVAASYLLVSNPHVILSMTDLDAGGGKALLYYPEYDLDLGEPRGSYMVDAQGLFTRRFEKGMVLVNPGETGTLVATLAGEYQRVVPVGGGMVPPDGAWHGTLTYENVGENIEIPPVSGVILSKR